LVEGSNRPPARTKRIELVSASDETAKPFGAPRRGRPRLPDDRGKRYPIALRTTKELKERLGLASDASGRSLAQELEFRLERSFAVQDITEVVRPLSSQIGELVLLIIGLRDGLSAPQNPVAQAVVDAGSIQDLLAKAMLEAGSPRAKIESEQVPEVPTGRLRAVAAAAHARPRARKRKTLMTLRYSTLDRRSLRRLKPHQRISEHGITAERLADGDLRYSINVMVDGRRIHRVIGKESDGVTRTQCEEFIGSAKSEARAGRLSLPKGRKLALSFGTAADTYIRLLENGAGKNIAIKRRQLRMYLKPFFGVMRLDAITTFAVDRYKKRRIDAGAAAGTINRELATL